MLRKEGEIYPYTPFFLQVKPASSQLGFLLCLPQVLEWVEASIMALGEKSQSVKILFRGPCSVEFKGTPYFRVHLEVQMQTTLRQVGI